MKHRDRNKANHNSVRRDGTADFLAKVLKIGIYASAIIPLIIFREFISPFHFG